MKKTILLIGLMMAGSAAAQSAPPGLSQEDMNKLMNQAQQLQACLSSLDAQAVERLKNESIAADARMNALCKDGKRDEAQAYAAKFGQQMQASKDLQAFQKCGEQAMGLMKDVPMQKVMQVAQNQQMGHVCDGYQ